MHLLKEFCFKDFTRIFLFFILLINNNLNSEKIDLMQIRLGKYSEELKLNEIQRKKLLEILTKEDEEMKHPVYSYNINDDSIDKIIKIEEENFNKKCNEINSFLNSDQYNQYLSIKTSAIKDKFTYYLIEELNLASEQSLELNAVIPVIIKKILAQKEILNNENLSGKYETDKDSPTVRDALKKINDLLIVLEKVLIGKLNASQLALYEERMLEIKTYLQKDVLGLEDKNLQGGSSSNGRKGGSGRG